MQHPATMDQRNMYTYGAAIVDFVIEQRGFLLTLWKAGWTPMVQYINVHSEFDKGAHIVKFEVHSIQVSTPSLLATYK